MFPCGCCAQETFDPEFYVGAYRNPGGAWRTTKYSDATGHSVSHDAEVRPHQCCRNPFGPPEREAFWEKAPRSVRVSPPLVWQIGMWERRLMYCVPVPGESPWCWEEDARQAAASLGAGGPKRARSRSPDPAGGAAAGGDAGALAPPPDPAKKPREGASGPGAAGQPTGAAAAAASSGPGLSANPSNHPLGESESRPACNVLVYEASRGGSGLGREGFHSCFRTFPGVGAAAARRRCVCLLIVQ